MNFTKSCSQDTLYPDSMMLDFIPITMILGQILPYLLSGLLYRGQPPYIIHIADTMSSDTQGEITCIKATRRVQFHGFKVLFQNEAIIA